jgi:hypothetical protein
LFIAYHAITFRLPLIFGALSPKAAFSELCADLSSTSAFGLPLVAMGYLAGVAALSYHFARGLNELASERYAPASPHAAKQMERATAAFSLLLFLPGAAIVLRLATGAGALSLLSPFN